MDKDSVESICRHLLRHLEYKIEVLGNDYTEAKFAQKLIIKPEDKYNSFQFRKDNNTLLAIPISDIKELLTVSNIRGRFGKVKNSVVNIVLHSSTIPKNKKSITFDIKDKRYVSLLQQQVELLKNAEINTSTKKAIKLTLNPELCSKCFNNFPIVINSKQGRICSNCFKQEYGKILMQTPGGNRRIARYSGGHKDHVTGSSDKGRIWLTEKFFIFATDDRDPSKRWEITIPLASVILLNLEKKQRKKYAKWEATNPDSFGFGSGFIYYPDASRFSGFLRSKMGSDSRLIPERLLVPYTDKDKQIQKPEFSISRHSIQKLAANLFQMVVKAKVALQNNGLEVNSNITEEQRFGSCFICSRKFEVYNLTVCDHCITSFCDLCKKNHSMKPELRFHPYYLGRHKRYPESTKNPIVIDIFSDRIEVGMLRIPYTSINDIENVEKSKISASRVLGLSLISTDLATVGALWQKGHVYTIIEYTDGFNDEQILIFDFRKSLVEAQRAIYDRMISFRLLKKQLSEDEVKQYKALQVSETLRQERDAKSKSGFAFDETNNPFHILKVRFAKGEITRKEYEDMRKLLEL